MASYLNGPNLQQFQSTPIQPLNQQIMRTIGARTQYYLNTAQQMKGEFDSATNKKLTDETNKSELQALTLEAEKQIKEITKKDLSVGDNVTKARNLLKPITTNQNFVIDEHLTSKISGELQKAQQDLSSKGSSNFNQLSIQNLQNTIEDLRTARKDDPNNEKWYTKFTEDSLGTTYVPFDAKLDQARKKEIQDRVKNGKIKIDIPDGQGRIVSQEEVDLNSIQAQEWLRATQTPQEIVQNQLGARVYANRLKKSSLEERAQLLSSVKGIQEYNTSKQVSYIQAEKHKVESSYALAPKEEQEKPEIKSAYEKAISSYNDAITKTKNQYKDFDDSSYFDKQKKNVAINQLETILGQRDIHGTIDGMGLNVRSSTIKSDAGYWERKKLEFNILKEANLQEYRKASLAKKSEKDGEGSGGSAINPNVTASSDVASLGTTDMNDEDKKLKIGEERKLELQGAIESKKENVAVELFNKLGVKVNSASGIGVQDFYTALDETDGNERLGTIIERLSGGSESNKKLVMALVNEGVQKINGNNGIYSTKEIPKVRVKDAKIYIKAALDNPEIFAAAVNKAGIDTGDFSTADYLAYQKEQLDKDIKTEKGKYEKPLREVAKNSGIPLVEKKTYDELKHYSKDQYITDITPELRAKRYNQEDINQLANYIKGNNYTTEEVNRIDKLLANPAYTRQHENLLARRSSLMNKPSQYEPYKKRWDNFEKNLHNKLADISTGASNYNTVAYKINPSNTPEDKTFDPNIDFNFTTFRQIINNNISAATPDGKTQDGELTTKIKRLVQEYPDVINGFSVYSDGQEQFIIPTINRTKESEKALNDVDLDPTEFTNMKIYLDKTTLPILRVAPQSKDLNDLQHGKVFGSNKFSIYNIGNGNNVIPAYDGSLKITAIDPTSGVFNIKEVSLPNYIQKNPNIGQAINAGKIDYSSAYLYSQEKDAQRVESILAKYKIDVSGEKNISWKDLPQKVKEELKRNTLTFKNIPE